MIVGIVGKKRVGKDTLCQIAADAMPGVSVQRFAFGDLMKAELSAALGVSVNHMDAHKDKFRPLYQWYGTQYRRDMCRRDYWIEALIQSPQWKNRLSHGVKFITDIRFMNEAAWAESQGAILIRINRPDLTPDTHQSETEMDRIKCDYVLNNKGSLADYIKSSQRLIRKLLKVHKMDDEAWAI